MIRWFATVCLFIILAAAVGIEAAAIGWMWLAVICACIGVVGVIAIVLGVTALLTWTE